MPSGVAPYLPPVHLVFDVIASMASFAMTAFVYQWRLQDAGDRISSAGPVYALVLVGGAIVGAYVFGTLNLWLSGIPGVGRSIVGALAGAIGAVEIYKHVAGIAGSTGIVFVPAFATSIAVGRIGCFLSGLDDQTHGTPTSLPWAHDFGDGIPRHPVQLYESAAMFAFLAMALVLLGRRDPLIMRRGFYLLVGWYAAQRFVWEFIKPYSTVVGPFNVFHFVCAALIVYAAVMLQRGAEAGVAQS